ncbi:DUF1697 domain-containing protein [Winogradskyella sp. A3E31]|uniref:DUF1697 domain-containing protein n=1 Tax=Winogradskyella sp. A3E31 TaxID=3349637 RepID=UPI00398B0E45
MTYIALLRGINVGGHRKVPMADLRELLSKVGFENVKTYIQSGNVVFQTIEEDVQKLEEAIEKEIALTFGFEVPVLVKTREELNLIFENCPFVEEQKAKSYFILFKKKPSKELIDIASQKKYPDDDFRIAKECIYLYPSKGYGQTKFNLKYFEKILNTEATARNYNTMLKLLSLSDIN